MEFGRLPGIEHVDFSLPPDDPRTAGRLGESAHAGWEVYTGCPEWTNAGWVGKIFPEGSREKDFLGLYSRQFNSIELNATHYNIPAPATVLKWKSMVPPHFRFFPKISRQLNHDKSLEGIDELLALYCDSMRGFGENLGMCFLQLPPGFSVGQAGTLEKFLLRFSAGNIPLAVEFRHASWFVPGNGQAKKIFALMEAAGITAVMTDVAGRRDVLHMRLTTGTAFIRFTANNLHPSDYKRMDDWVQRICSWKERGLERLCFFFHTPDKSLCVELAVYFTDRLNEACGTSVPKPVLIRKPPVQTYLF